MNIIPEHTVWTTIGEVVEPFIEQGAPKGTADFCYVDISSINKASKRIVDPKILPTSKAPSRARQHLSSGDVLVSMTRPNLNSVAIVPAEMQRPIASTGFCVLRSIEIVPSYLFYLVQTEDFVSAMSMLVQGALYPAVRPKDIFGYRFRLPPVSEQHRIVAKIEELFSNLADGIGELRKAQAQLKRYRQAVLKAAVTGELTREWREVHKDELEPASELLTRILNERRATCDKEQLSRMKVNGQLPTSDGRKQTYEQPAMPSKNGLPNIGGWSWISLGLVVDAIDPQPSHRTPPAVANGTPYIGMADVVNNRIIFDGARRVSSEVLTEQKKRYRLNEGDFIIGKIGTIGKPAKLMPPFEYALSANVVLIQPRKNFTDEKFCFHYMGSPLMEALLTAGSRATTQSAFGIQKVRMLPYPLAPLAEQQQIANEIDQLLSISDAVEICIAQCLKQANRTRQSILQRAFEGTLVPQDPNDEPAELLLERIKIERAKREGEKQGQAKSNRRCSTKNRPKRTEGAAA